MKEENLDVLQNLETAIVEIWREHPEMNDYVASRAYEAAFEQYRAEARGHQPKPTRLAGLDAKAFEAVKAMCEFRLGRSREFGDVKELTPVPVEQLVGCLRELKKSVERHTKVDGRHGYLTFVDKFVSMKLDRLPHEPSALVDFFQEGLEHLGAVCERTWYDRLQIVAEGAAAKLWNPEGSLCETEVGFPSVDDTAPRDAAKEVFPGCPLTFRLAETICPNPVPLERFVLQADGPGQPPATEVAEKLWQAQRPGTSRWRLESSFAPQHHFGLLALVRCEIQAIDQHWSLHRLALSLLDGELEHSLAAEADFARLIAEPPLPIAWPVPDLGRWSALLCAALEQDLATDLAAIRARQENYLRRELDRIDDYFRNYERELSQRGARAGRGPAKVKTTERLAAARAEHTRRREDQVQRHEIRVIPHLDALLVVAEPAWQATVAFVEKNQPRTLSALFVTRARRWVLSE